MSLVLCFRKKKNLGGRAAVVFCYYGESNFLIL
jgi:hypothetical protein